MITWTEEDLTQLSDAYVGIGLRGYPVFPIELLDRHTKDACFQKAHKRKLTKYFVEQRIEIEKWTDLEIGYFAGIVDGEGCIHIAKGERSNGTPYFTPRLHVSNTDGKLMEWLIKRIGKGAHYQERRERKNHKKCFTFVISSVTDLLGVLRAIEPHLIIKRDKAKEVIKILEDRIQKRNTMGRKGIFND